MRILFITNIFPNPIQPTKGVFNRDLARALARDHEIRVVSPVSWVDEWLAARHGGSRLGHPRSASVDGVEVHYPRYFYPPKVLRETYGWFLWRSVGGLVRRLLAAHPPDAVLGYWAHPDGAVAVRAARHAGVPSVVMVGGSDVLLLTRDRGRRRQILSVLHGTDAAVAVSQDLATKLVEFGIAPAKVHLIRRGIDRERFSPGNRAEARRRLEIPAKGGVLLWVGRMVPVKGLDVLLRAVRRLKDRGAAFHLYLVGDGPLRAELEAQAAALGVSGDVSFVGGVDHDRLPDWYRAADLTVLPSRSEGVPNVLRESLACGTPFVASRVGGVHELAGGDRDGLVEPEDPAALAAALERALSDAGPARIPTSPSADLADAVAPLTRLFRDLTAGTAGRPPVEEPDLRETVRPA